MSDTNWFSTHAISDRLTRICEPHVHPFFRANMFHVVGRDVDLVIDFGMGLADLRSVLGLGYDTLQSTCTTLGIPGLTALGDVSECLVRQHVCRAGQILESQNPRANELLLIGGAVSR